MEISITQEQDFVSVKLAGVINEDSDLAEHLEMIVGSLVAIDLSEVDRINSCGVRDWVNWISALEARGSKMLFLDCSPSIVAQINLVNNFTGSGRIKSLYLPYYCEDCNEEHSLLYEAEDLTSEQLPPVSRCNGCEKFMDFDDMPDAYFAFLSNPEQLLLSSTLTQAQLKALSMKSARAAKPVFPIGSTSLQDIDQLLEATTKTEAEFSKEEPAPEKEAARTLNYAAIASLLAAAAIATYFLF
jgi:anti-anti-sigma regulatory factor